MKGSPYVPWYHGDFLRSTAGWMPMERFTYRMLLCAQHEVGVLPNDMARLATIAGIDMATMNNVWPVVGKKFIASRAGLVNKRMRAHLEKQIDFRRRQSEGGKKLKFPVDESADPPISVEEAMAAGAGTCSRHGGLVGAGRGDRDGMGFLCTACGKYRRFRKCDSVPRKPIRYRPLGYA